MATLTVDWTKSPRIITVAAPDTEITIQELINELRTLESDLSAMDDDPLVAAAGKEELGGGVLVGITATLQNAVLQFEARTTPLTNGTATTADSNGIYLEDTAATFITDGILVGYTVFNANTGAMAVITKIISETKIEHQALSGGSSVEWTLNDAYLIYENAICNVSGGNLVAVDGNDVSIDPILQAPNVTIVRTSSSSATLQDLESIQAASFNGVVVIDVHDGMSGTTFPAGTHETPSNNLADAKVIANSRGIETFEIHDMFTVGATDDISHFKIVGEGATKTQVILIPGCTIDSAEFQNLYLSGTSDGTALIARDCVVDNLLEMNGFFFQCALDDVLKPVTTGGVLNIFNCFDAIPGSGHPHIDLAGVSSTTIGVRGYNGGIGFINADSNPTLSIDMASGMVHLQPTVASGEIIVRGTTIVNDESIGGNINKAGVVNPQANADALLDTDITLHTITNSVGDWLQNKLLTVSKFLGMS